MPPEMIRTVLLVSGMSNNQSRERLIEVLERLEGVQEVEVSLYRARAAVRHVPACPPAALVRAVVQCGFGVALGEQRSRLIGNGDPD